MAHHKLTSGLWVPDSVYDRIDVQKMLIDNTKLVDEYVNKIGDNNDMGTDHTDTVAGAVKEINTRVGKTTLTTTSKNLTDAVNELDMEIGDLSDLHEALRTLKDDNITDIVSILNQFDDDINDSFKYLGRIVASDSISRTDLRYWCGNRPSGYWDIYGDTYRSEWKLPIEPQSWERVIITHYRGTEINYGQFLLYYTKQGYVFNATRISHDEYTDWVAQSNLAIRNGKVDINTYIAADLFNKTYYEQIPRIAEDGGQIFPSGIKFDDVKTAVDRSFKYPPTIASKQTTLTGNEPTGTIQLITSTGDTPVKSNTTSIVVGSQAYSSNDIYISVGSMGVFLGRNMQLEVHVTYKDNPIIIQQDSMYAYGIDITWAGEDESRVENPINGATYYIGIYWYNNITPTIFVTDSEHINEFCNKYPDAEILLRSEYSSLSAQSRTSINMGDTAWNNYNIKDNQLIGVAIVINNEVLIFTINTSNTASIDLTSSAYDNITPKLGGGFEAMTEEEVAEMAAMLGDGMDDTVAATNLDTAKLVRAMDSDTEDTRSDEASTISIQEDKVTEEE